MSFFVYDNPSLFIVVTGAAHQADLARAPDIARGLTFRQQAPAGAIDLAIAAPTDLAAFADLATAAILKPVCLPIALTSLRHGIVNAQLRHDPAAHRLAQQFLAAMAADRHPAHPRRCLPYLTNHLNTKES